MGSRYRFVFWLAITLVAAITLGISLLAEFIGKGSEALNHFAGWATIGAIPIALICFVTAWMEGSRASSKAALAPEQVESRFGYVLEYEADAKHSLVSDRAGRNRLVNLRFRNVTSPLRDYRGGVTGDLASVAEYFKSLSPGRLVVLGGPGCGKTVLALELQMQLLKLRGQYQADPLPVLVDAASYDPGNTWSSWLAWHLAGRYSLPERAAAQLVADGRILPIIDGVDELERATAAALVTELNAFIREREFGRGGDRLSGASS